MQIFLNLAIYIRVISYLKSGHILDCFKNNYRVALDAQCSHRVVSNFVKTETDLFDNLYKTGSH